MIIMRMMRIIFEYYELFQDFICGIRIEFVVFALYFMIIP